MDKISVTYFSQELGTIDLHDERKMPIVFSRSNVKISYLENLVGITEIKLYGLGPSDLVPKHLMPSEGCILFHN